MRHNLNQILLGLLILLPVFSFTSILTRAQSFDFPAASRTDIWIIELTPTRPPSVTPNPTQIIIFPLVKKDGEKAEYLQGQSSPEITPELPKTPTPTPTPTPILIPPQDLSTTEPIVFGAMMIVIVIVCGWFIVTRSELQAR